MLSQPRRITWSKFVEATNITVRSSVMKDFQLLGYTDYVVLLDYNIKTNT
jgi:hypothetical protein